MDGESRWAGPEVHPHTPGGNAQDISGGLAQVEIVERDIPELEAQDMLGRVEMASVCGTDVHWIFEPEPFLGSARRAASRSSQSYPEGLHSGCPGPPLGAGPWQDGGHPGLGPRRRAHGGGCQETGSSEGRSCTGTRMKLNHTSRPLEWAKSIACLRAESSSVRLSRPKVSRSTRRHRTRLSLGRECSGEAAPR